jgi:hypothetical protein
VYLITREVDHFIIIMNILIIFAILLAIILLFTKEFFATKQKIFMYLIIGASVFSLFLFLLPDILIPDYGPGVTNSIKHSKEIRVFQNEFYIPNDMPIMLNKQTLNVMEIWTERSWTFQENTEVENAKMAERKKRGQTYTYHYEVFCIKTKKSLFERIATLWKNREFTLGRVDIIKDDEKVDSTIVFDDINSCLLCSDLMFALGDSTVIYIYPGIFYHGDFRTGKDMYRKPIPAPIDSFLIIKKK